MRRTPLKKRTKFKFYEPVFQAEIEVTIGKKNSDDKFDAYVEDVDVKDKSGVWIAHYHLHLDNRKDFYSLIHETLHLVEHIFDGRELPFNKKTDEFIAYYQTFLFRTIWRKINEKKTK